MAESLIESFKRAATERLSHAFFGTFLLAWCYWNWELLVLLTSGVELNARIPLIRTAFAEQSLIKPLLAGLTYAYLLSPAASMVGTVVSTVTENFKGDFRHDRGRHPYTQFVDAQTVVRHATDVLMVSLRGDIRLLIDQQYMSKGKDDELNEVIDRIDKLLSNVTGRDLENLARVADSIRKQTITHKMAAQDMPKLTRTPPA